MSTISDNTSSIGQINQLIRSRRSIFPDQFDKDKTIPEEVIWQLLENANWAPNHKQTEPWRFVVFSGAGLKKIASFQATRYKETAGERFRQDKYDKLLTNPLLCSQIIAIVLKRSTTVNIPEIEEISAVACAVENLYLSATAYGLGGYWSTGGITYDPAARDFLGLEGEDRLLGLFYLGVVRVPSPGGRRGDIKNKTKWVRE